MSMVMVRRALLVTGLVAVTVPQIVSADGSDSSSTHSYTSTCDGDLLTFTNTSDPSSTGNGVIEFRSAGASLTLVPGESGVLDPGHVSPDTSWDVVFFDLGEPYVFDGGSFAMCDPPETTTSTTVPPTGSIAVTEGCNDGEPVVQLANTGTVTNSVTVGSVTHVVDPGATIAAVWPAANGDFVMQVDWQAFAAAAPSEDVGPAFASGAVFLANACGVTTGPVESPGGVSRNIAVAVPASAPTPVASFDGTGTVVVDLGKGLLADGEPYLLDVVFTAADGLDTLTVNELDGDLTDQGGGLEWSSGSFQGRFLLNTGDSATRHLEVVTDGTWTLTIWSLLSTVDQWAGGGTHGVGPNVLLFGGAPGIVSFAHRGAGDLLVDIYDDDGVHEASIRESGNVDGTIDLQGSPAVVAVVTDGEWWLRR